MISCLFLRFDESIDHERNYQDSDEEERSNGHAQTIFIVLEGREIHLKTGHHCRVAGATVCQNQNVHKTLYNRNNSENAHQPDLATDEGEIEMAYAHEHTRALKC